MNQGIAFARTIHALNADDFRASKLGLLIAVILLAAWTWWMLGARIPQYESTANVRIESGRAIAYFPSTDQIHPGQKAFVTLGRDTVTARVQNVTSEHAELVFTSQSPIPNPQSPRANASAEVEISRISPAAIALRTLGRAHP